MSQTIPSTPSAAAADHAVLGPRDRSTLWFTAAAFALALAGALGAMVVGDLPAGPLAAAITVAVAAGAGFVGTISHLGDRIELTPEALIFVRPLRPRRAIPLESIAGVAHRRGRLVVTGSDGSTHVSPLLGANGEALLDQELTAFLRRVAGCVPTPEIDDDHPDPLSAAFASRIGDGNRGWQRWPTPGGGSTDEVAAAPETEGAGPADPTID